MLAGELGLSRGYLALVLVEIDVLLAMGYASVVEADLVVAGDYDLMPEVELVEEVEEIVEVLFPAVVGEVTRVDEDVSLHGEDLLQRRQLPVGVRHCNDFQLPPWTVLNPLHWLIISQKSSQF